jgi:enoyl-CoA hydratase
VPIHLRVDGGVALVTIERTERRNALNLEALEQLDAAIGDATDQGVRALVLTGAAGHFCAGADLSELEDMSFTLRLRAMLDHLAELPVVTIAAISGACMGLGMQLALACDIRFAMDGATFGVPVAKLGLMVDHWTLQRLERSVGPGTARLMVLGAQTLDTAEAVAAGLVQRVGDLDAATELATGVTQLAPLAISGSKLGFDLLPRRLDEAAYREAFERAWASDDLVEGRAAFAERRSPRFSGR